jgi:hypothetical protein
LQVGEEQREQLSGDVALEAAGDVASGESFFGAPVGVGAGVGVVAEADHGDGPERVVGLAVATAVESVTCGLARRGRDGAGAAERRERRFAREPFGVVSGRDEELGGDVGADTVLCDEVGCCGRDELVEVGTELADLRGEREVAAGEGPIVGSGLPAHEKRGVDVAVAFFSERAESEANRAKVGDYFWRESGKWNQKRPPEDFGSLRFYGYWGQKVGFRPVVSVEMIEEMLFFEMRRMLVRLRIAKLRQLQKKTGRRVEFKASLPRGRDGLTVFDVDARRIGPMLLAVAEQNALVKAGAERRDERALDRRGGWRSLREIEAPADDAPDAMLSPRESELVANFDEVEYDPWEEAERLEAERLQHEAEIDAALDAAVARWERINFVRVANGQPPKPRPPRWHLGRLSPVGRGR